MQADGGEQLRDVLFIIAFHKEGTQVVSGLVSMIHAGCQAVYTR